MNLVEHVSTAIPEWAYNYVLRPYLEGMERVNRFIQGVDLFIVGNPRLNWHERIISLISGVTLLLPFINVVIWLAMQTFGQTQAFTPDYSPLSFEAKECEKEESVLAAEIAETGQIPQETREFVYVDTPADGSQVPSKWMIRKFANHTEIVKNELDETTTAIYDVENRLVKYHRKDPRVELHAVRTPHYLDVTLEIQDKPKVVKRHKLRPETPWIQQLTVGLRDFAGSPKPSQLYYFIKEDEGTIHEMRAEKAGVVQLAGSGKKQLIEVYANSWTENMALKAATLKGFAYPTKMWFDPGTADLSQMEFGMPIDRHNLLKGFQKVLSSRSKG